MQSIDDAANGIFDGFGTIVLLFAALGLISVTALNLYGGSLTLISAIDSFRRVRPTLVGARRDDRVHRGALARRRADLAASRS